MEQFKVECIVVGGGVIGLSIARALALAGKEVLLVEKEGAIGTGISSRNSEVIHAGIYYPKGSLKAELCVKGKALLYEYAKTNQIPHQQLGKLIVAQNHEDVQKLATIQQHANDNGVSDLVYLNHAELVRLEPELSSIAGIFSPTTGIIDSHSLMLQLQADFENAGGLCVFNTELELHKTDDTGVHLLSKPEDAKILAKYCINATGLNAVDFCQPLGGSTSAMLPKAYFAKGSYFSYQGLVPFRHLIYPVPVQGGLGVHLTLDMNRAAKFGPDVEWLTEGEAIDYSVPETKQQVFATAVKSYWPNVIESKLCADYSGVRPKISGPFEPAADFYIQDEVDHGVRGLINLLGIESPGLTSCLAIAEHVLEKVK